MKDILVFGATINLSMDKRNGIMKKVFAEAKALSKDYDVYMWGFCENHIVYFNKDTMVQVVSFSNKRERRNLYFKEITAFSLSHHAKVFYFRYATVDFNLLHTLKSFRAAGMTNIIEIPTYPYKAEYMGTWKNRCIYALDVFLRGQLKKYVSRVVNFTETPLSIYGIPCIITMNGVDFSTIKPVEKPCLSPVTIIAIGSMLPMHGFDRLVSGVAKYLQDNEPRPIKVYIVGDGPQLNSYKELADKNNLGDTIVFTGQLSGKELDDIFDTCAVAVGSLGLHRNGLERLSTLKNREYVSRGLPVAYATSDNLLDSQPFSLILPSNEEPISIKDILSFIDKVYSNPNINKEIREATFSLCDMSITMQPVLDFLSEESI